jgi:hypothetical protein
MMSDWPVLHGPGVFETSSFLSLTCSAVADTKSSWEEVIASTKYNSDYIYIAKRHGNTSKTYLLDIGIGAAGSESVLIGDILTSLPATYNYGSQGWLTFPFRVPRGSRISARVQASSGGGGYQIYLGLLGSGFLTPGGYNKVINYGITSLGATHGTQYDPGATAWTRGSWLEIVPSLSHDIKGFFLAICKRNRTSLHAHWDIYTGLGSAGSEVDIGPMLLVGTAYSSCDINVPYSMFYPIHLKAGSRISISAMCNTNSSPSRIFDVAFYGVY